jgi:dynein heavy chain
VLKLKENPGPREEILFWKNKSENLNSIYDQLSSVEVKNILHFLENNKSTYKGPFAKLQEEVKKAKIEANDNYRFLRLLSKHFDYIESSGIEDFPTIYEKFTPIMHTILLIWKNSNFYNTPPRLVVLIREICNLIIKKAQAYGDSVFS